MPTIRNISSSATVVIGDKRSITLARAGSPTGDDVAYISDSEMQDPSIRGALRKGKFLVLEPEGSDDSDGSDITRIAPEDVAARVAANTEAAQARDTEVLSSLAEGADYMDRKQDRDLVAHTCIGPSAQNPRLQCGNEVLRASAVAKGDIPPLCALHEGLSYQYIATEEEGENLGDKPQTKWSRATVETGRR